MTEPTTKQVVAIFTVDSRATKEAIAKAIEQLTPHFRHCTVWDSLMEFLEDLPEIEYDPDEEDDGAFHSGPAH